MQSDQVQNSRKFNGDPVEKMLMAHGSSNFSSRLEDKSPDLSNQPSESETCTR